jgi:hypothetical protein
MLIYFFLYVLVTNYSYKEIFSLVPWNSLYNQVLLYTTDGIPTFPHYLDKSIDSILLKKVLPINKNVKELDFEQGHCIGVYMCIVFQLSFVHLMFKLGPSLLTT